MSDIHFNIKLQNDRKYSHASWGYAKRKTHDCLGLDVKDVNHLQQIYKKYQVEAESLDRVAVEFIIQREKLSRFIIKELDTMLRVGGDFEVIIVNSKAHSSYFRSRDQIKYEFSVSTNGRYSLTKTIDLFDGKVLKLVYKKNQSSLPSHDLISRWSFGIVTNGKKSDKVKKLISSIVALEIPDFEIIICGPYPCSDDNVEDKLIVLSDVVLENDTRAPTPVKKNKIIQQAKYNNICILHDRFTFHEEWYSNFKKYGNYFDFLCMPTMDTSGNRFKVDWMTFCYPLTQIVKQNISISYSTWSPDVIIQGGILVGKKNIISSYMFDERLYWEELEDMQLSKQAYLGGAFINIDVNNFVYSDAVNHKSQTAPKIIDGLLDVYRWCRGRIVNFVKYNLIVFRYNKKLDAIE